MVYVDGLRDWGWKLGASCHLVADTVRELHEFAARIGLKPEWFQTAGGPHYDLTARRRELAVRAGAVQVTAREVVEVLRKHRPARRIKRRSEV